MNNIGKLLNHKTLIFLLTISFAFIFIRHYKFNDFATCNTDQGLYLLDTYKFEQSKKIFLIGPETSIRSEGKVMYLGPATYYMSMPFFEVFGWNQQSYSYLYTALLLFGALLVYFGILKLFKNKLTAVLFIILITFSPTSIHYTRIYWPIVIPFASILVGLLLFIKNTKKSNLLFLLIGLTLGLGLQIHYGFLLAVIPTVFWILFARKLSQKTFFLLATGFLVGFSPIILFEIRHGFYNSKVLISYIIDVLSGSASPSKAQHYFFSLLPFFYLLISLTLAFIFKKHKLLIIFVTAVLVAAFYISSLPPQGTGFLMQENWDCKSLEKMAAIITVENKRDYNVIDLFSGDNRAQYLRMLLTVTGNPPNPVNQYQDSDIIYVYTNITISRILKEPTIWEIESAKPLKVTNLWNIKNEIYLYELEKI